MAFFESDNMTDDIFDMTESVETNYQITSDDIDKYLMEKQYVVLR